MPAPEAETSRCVNGAVARLFGGQRASSLPWTSAICTPPRSKRALAKGRPGSAGAVAEAVERDPVGQGDRAPGGFVEDQDVFGEVGARQQRAGGVRIVVAGGDEHRPSEAAELLEEKAHRRRSRALGFVQVAADGQRVRAAGERLVDDARERVAKRCAVRRRRAYRETSFRGGRRRSGRA